MKPVEDKVRITATPAEGEAVWELEPLHTSPCTLACPARINVRGYVSLIADGHLPEALELIREQNPFPGVTGRICPRPCEAVCTRGEFDGPIAICALKRTVFDLEMERGETDRPEYEVTRKEKIAIAGSGPAGLSAAVQLERLGYRVTVFEAADRPGGMLNVIPEFRLPRRVVRREIDWILSGNTELECNTAVGRDVSWKALKRRGYSALLLATGAWRAERRFKPSGGRIVHALELLRSKGKGYSPGDLDGAGVVVAGNGTMALDAARTAVRLGSRRVTWITENSGEKAPVLPEYLAQAEDEGVDIKFLSRMEDIRENDNTVSYRRLKAVDMDSTGRERLEETGREYSLGADLVVDAYSRSFDKRSLQVDFDLPRGVLGEVRVDPDTMAVNDRGVFAAGDMISGPKSVVEAVALGMKGAREIHRYISGESVSSPFDVHPETESGRREYGLRRMPLEKKERKPMPLLEGERRKNEFTEAETGLDRRDARREAQRCLLCGPCRECESCADICERKDYELMVDGQHITIHADRDFWEGECSHLTLHYGDQKREVELIRTICSVDQDICVGCGRCERICGFDAARVFPGPDECFVAGVDATACKGCGTCISVCPTGAMDQTRFGSSTLYGRLEDITGDKSRVVFVCRWVVPCRTELPGDTILIETGCSGRLTTGIIMEAAAGGGREVVICRCREGDCHYRSGEERAEEVITGSRKLLAMLGIAPSRVAEVRCSPTDFNHRLAAGEEEKV